MKHNFLDMKHNFLKGLAFALCLAATPLPAQEAAKTLELQRQLQAMRDSFDEQQRQHREQMRVMQSQINQLLKASSTPPAAKAMEPNDPIDPTSTTSVDSVSAPTPDAAGTGAAELKNWRPSDRIGLNRGNVSLDLGLTGTFSIGGSTAKDLNELNLGGHDPNARGFTVQGVEAHFSGAVDPYFRGQANLNFAISADGESFMELEEAWLESVALPWNLQLQAGQIYSDFGRHNSLHLHDFNFVDMPLAVGRLLGPDGMRNPGARVSWLAPTPWYTELSLTAMNSGGENASSFRGGGHAHGGGEEEGIPLGFRHADNDRGVRGLRDLLINPRLQVAFDLSDTQTILLGGSAAFGPNNSGGGGENYTQIYGADISWKWQARDHDRGYPFVSLQSEFLARKYDAGAFDWDEDGNGGDGDGNGFVDEEILTDPLTGLPATLTPETLSDYGLFSQVLYGFKPGWIAGLRFGYLFGERADYELRGLGLADNAGGIDPAGIDLERGGRYRVSPNLTWLPTEYSKVRLQYNYDDRREIGVDHSLWLQLEMSLGAHAAHTY